MSFIDELAGAFGFGDEFSETSWADRLAEAAFTPPSGIRITFDYEDISYKRAKKGTAFEFGGADVTLVQDHGVTGRRYPMRIFFWGADVDKKAAVFETALSERGIGKLESPLYGEQNVVVLGDWTRRDHLKSAANQTVFEVTFFDTVDTSYPVGQEDPVSAVLAALDLFGEASAAEFATSLDIGSVSEEQGFLDTVNGLIDTVGDALGTVAAVQGVVNDQFNDLVDTVNNAVDTFVGDPLALAFSTQQMIQAPAAALANIDARLEAYGNLADSIFGGDVATPGGPGGLGPQIGANTGVGNDAQEPNDFHTKNLFASTYVTGSILSTIYTASTRGGSVSNAGVKRIQKDATDTGVAAGKNKFGTAEQAIAAAEVVLAQMDSLTEWQDANFKSISGGNLSPSEITDFVSAPTNTDIGGAYSHLKNAVSLTAGLLLQISFSLAQERRIVLDRPRGMLDLMYELYGVVDNITLDFFIDTNNLTNSEIIELPKGRTVVYYPQ